MRKQSETRSLLSDAIDKMVGIKDILKQTSTPEPTRTPAPPPAPPPVDKRTQPLVPQRQSRLSNLTPQEVSKKIAEAKERVDKRSQPLQTIQIPQLFGTLGEPFVPSALEKSVFRDVEPSSKQLIGSFLSPPTLGQPDVASAVLGSSDETKDETPFV